MQSAAQPARFNVKRKKPSVWLLLPVLLLVGLSLLPLVLYAALARVSAAVPWLLQLLAGAMGIAAVMLLGLVTTRISRARWPASDRAPPCQNRRRFRRWRWSAARSR